MTAVLIIAGNTVRELVRSKLLYNLLIFAVLFVTGSLLVAQLTVGNWDRIILDMGLGALEVAGGLMAIVIGVGLFAGLVLLLVVNAVVIVAVLRAVLWLARYPLSTTALQAAALLCVEFAVLAALAVLFASFSTPILAGSYALALFFIGHLLPDLSVFAEKSHSSAARTLARGFYLLLPDLELLNLKSHASNKLPVAAEYVAHAAGYGLAYAAVVLGLAILIFSRRDLN